MQTSHGRRAFFFFNDTATTEIYTLSLHDALPISHGDAEPSSDRLLSEREMARALDQVLHEKIVRALLDQPYLEHGAVQLQPGRPVRVGACGGARGLCLAHGLPRLSDVSKG